MKLNLNATAKVTLTSFGAGVYNAWVYRSPTWCHLDDKHTGDVLECQLWELMLIFGSTTRLGMVEVPFVDNAIEVEARV